MGRHYPKRLTNDQLARICYLHDVEELSGSAIAERTGFSKAQVYRAIIQARETERRRLKAA